MTRTSRVFVWSLVLALGPAALEPARAWGASAATEQAASPPGQQREAREAQAEDERKALEQQRAGEQLAEEVQKREQERRRLTPLSVEILVTRFQGDKKVSSLPYTLAVNANELSGAAGGGVAQIRMGATVPVPSIVPPKPNPAGAASAPAGPVIYRDIGTNIDCSAQRMADGTFQLRISVEDTSVYTDIQDKTTPTVGDIPVFRKFSSTNMLVMGDGQTREFTAATDRVNGEVVRVAVTLRVVR